MPTDLANLKISCYSPDDLDDMIGDCGEKTSWFIFQRAESVYQAVTWRFLKDIFLNAYIIVLS